jgi:trehalose-6-phosphatase
MVMVFMANDYYYYYYYYQKKNNNNNHNNNLFRLEFETTLFPLASHNSLRTASMEVTRQLKAIQRNQDKYLPKNSGRTCDPQSTQLPTLLTQH